MANSSPEPGKPNSPAGPPLGMSARDMQSDIPLWVSLLGALVGLGLLLGGVWIVYPGGQLVIQSNLMIALGLALVAIAFGTRAKVAQQNYYMVGSGAVALIFFGALTYAPKDAPPPIPAQSIEGTLYGSLPKPKKGFAISADRTKAYGRWESDARYTFYVPGQDINTVDCIWIEYEAANADGQAQDKFISVDAVALRQKVLGGWNILFNLQAPEGAGNPVVYLTDTTDVPAVKCGTANTSLSPLSSPSQWLPGLIGSALAGPDIESLINELMSDETFSRRDARDALAAIGIDAISPLMAALENAKGVYRIEVGAPYVLRQILQKDPGLAAKIRSLISDNQIAVFAWLAAHPDGTVRDLAVPALIDLADPRSIDTMVAILRDTRDETAHFAAAQVLSALFANSKDEAERLSIAEKIRPLMAGLDPKTQDTLSGILVATGSGVALDGAIFGWVFSGVAAGQPWDGKLFKYLGSAKDGMPQPGDDLAAFTEVYIRKDIIQFDEKLGWVNAEAVGVIPADGIFHIDKVETAKSGYIWYYGSNKSSR